MNFAFSCKNEDECKKLRVDLSAAKLELGSARQKSDRDQLFAEGAAIRIIELEARLMAASGATIIGRDTETIVKLQRADLLQRKNLDRLDKERIALGDEVARLEKLCRIGGVDTTPVRSASPSPSAQKLATMWSAMTGNQGAQPEND